jgi:hypothetical protein
MMKTDSEPDQVAGSETPTAASAIKDEVDALSGDIEKLFRKRRTLQRCARFRRR